MVFTSPIEAFMVLFKLALLVGVFLASPFVFREMWRFISPGLYDRERKWGIGFVIASVILFVGGAIFAYSYVLPASLQVLPRLLDGEPRHHQGRAWAQTVDVQAVAAVRHQADDHDGRVLRPDVDAAARLRRRCSSCRCCSPILAILGIVSAGQLWRFNRYAIVLFAVAGAVLTPGDLVVGQLAMTASLTVLYNLSILVAFIVGKKRKEREAAEERALRSQQAASRAT